MFERYTEKARRVVFFARYEASQLGSPVIDTECLMLGIVRESADLIISVAGPSAIETIKNRILQQHQFGDKFSTSVDFPFSEEAKQVLISAQEEADQLDSRVITSKHILIGLTREENCLAQRILSELGVTPEAVRKYQERGENTAEAILGDRVAGKPRLNQAFQRAVTDAVEEASLLRSKSVKPEHLLLALLRDEQSSAAKILTEAGLSHDSVRRKLKGD
jgi:ATP-dependent Clp protease ATP-binding subunit ClpC